MMERVQTIHGTIRHLSKAWDLPKELLCAYDLANPDMFFMYPFLHGQLYGQERSEWMRKLGAQRIAKVISRAKRRTRIII